MSESRENGEGATSERTKVQSASSRRIRLVLLLLAGERATVQELASQLNCSRRTLFRDLGILRGGGLMTTCDPPDYNVEAWLTDDRRPLTSLETALSDDEVLSVALAIAAIGDGPLGSLAQTLRPLRLKLRALVHPADRPRLDRATAALAGVEALGSAVPGWANLLMRQLVTSILDSDTVLVRHEVVGRRFDTPLEFVAIETDSQGTLCMVGRPAGAAETVSIFCSDITSIEPWLVGDKSPGSVASPHIRPPTELIEADET